MKGCELPHPCSSPLQGVLEKTAWLLAPWIRQLVEMRQNWMHEFSITHSIFIFCESRLTHSSGKLRLQVVQSLALPTSRREVQRWHGLYSLRAYSLPVTGQCLMALLPHHPHNQLEVKGRDPICPSGTVHVGVRSGEEPAARPRGECGVCAAPPHWPWRKQQVIEAE